MGARIEVGLPTGQSSPNGASCDDIDAAPSDMKCKIPANEGEGKDVNGDPITKFGDRKIQFVNLTTFRTISVSVDGALLNQTGISKSHEEAVTVSMSMNKAVLGSARKEEVRIVAPGMTCKITSNKANKFIKLENQLDHLHLDLSFVKLDLGKAYGALPEMWGLKEISKSTLRLLGKPQLLI